MEVLEHVVLFLMLILDINGTDYVQVENDVTINNNAALSVASEANLVQVDNVSTVTLNGTGTGIVQKTTTPLQAYYSYTYWSSPFVNETIRGDWQWYGFGAFKSDISI